MTGDLAARKRCPRRGEVLESPTNGQRAVFRETAEDTGGEFLRELAGAPGPPLGISSTVPCGFRVFGLSLRHEWIPIPIFVYSVILTR